MPGQSIHIARRREFRWGAVVAAALAALTFGAAQASESPKHPLQIAQIEKPAGVQSEIQNPAMQSQINNLINQNVCDGTICVSLPAVAASIHKQLDGATVGYAFFVGNALTGPKALFGAHGQAVTAANAPAANFTPETQMQIASTSKVLTALATLKVMSSNVNKPASLYFPPSWTLPANSIVKPITVRRFISQTSGVMQYYASSSGQDYASLKAFFTQPIANPNAPFYCPGPPNPNATPPIPQALPNPIIATTQACYSDANFGLMRVVLPRAAGSTSSDPQTLANTYVSQVWQNVFNPVGVGTVRCSPSGPAALGYNYPGTSPGTNFGGNLTLSCGDWGWWVSVKDYASVLVSLNAQDGKILGNCELDDMVNNPSNHPVGWDVKTDGTHRWVEKNGGDSWTTSAGSGQISSSVGIYGGQDGCVIKGKGTAPIPGVAAVLFINSNINGVKYGADTVLHNALVAATSPD
jgi:CubicO group peptidase (beta-lactamase class C family)